MKNVLFYWSPDDEGEYGRFHSREENFLPIEAGIQLSVDSEITDLDEVSNCGVWLKVIRLRYSIEENTLFIQVVVNLDLIEIEPKDFAEYIFRKWLSSEEINRWIKMP